MADTTINNGSPLRFEAGGVFRLTDGATDYAIVNRDRGTLQIEEGGYEVLRYRDRDANKLPLRGGEEPTKIKLTMKLTSLNTADIVALSKKKESAKNLMYSFAVAIEWPDTDATATIHKRSFASAYFVKPAMVKEGADFDTVEIEMEAVAGLGTDTVV